MKVLHAVKEVSSIPEIQRYIPRIIGIDQSTNSIYFEYIPGKNCAEAYNEACDGYWSGIFRKAAEILRILHDSTAQEGRVRKIFEEMLEQNPPVTAHDEELFNLATNLLDSIPKHGKTSIIHGDYQPANWIRRDRTLVAIVDWETAMRSVPEHDLARFAGFVDNAECKLSFFDSYFHSEEEKMRYEKMRTPIQVISLYITARNNFRVPVKEIYKMIQNGEDIPQSTKYWLDKSAPSRTFAGDYAILDRICRAKYRRKFRDGKYVYAQRSWKKLATYFIFAKEILERIESGKETLVIDVGAGPCNMYRILSENLLDSEKRLLKYIAIDINRKILQRCPIPDENKIIADVRKSFPVSDSIADFILAIDVVKYWTYGEFVSFLRTSRNKLKDNGKLLITVDRRMWNRRVDEDVLSIATIEKSIDACGYVVEKRFAHEGAVWKSARNGPVAEALTLFPEEIVDAFWAPVFDKMMFNIGYVLRKGE